MENNYGWKVGETYKSREGRDYKLLFIIPEKEGCRTPLVFKTENSVVVSRKLDGTYWSSPSMADIPPPSPPIVVSDAVMVAFSKAYEEHICDMYRYRAGIEAAITQYIKEQTEPK